MKISDDSWRRADCVMSGNVLPRSHPGLCAVLDQSVGASVLLVNLNFGRFLC